MSRCGWKSEDCARWATRYIRCTDHNADGLSVFSFILPLRSLLTTVVYTFSPHRHLPMLIPWLLALPLAILAAPAQRQDEGADACALIATRVGTYH